MRLLRHHPHLQRKSPKTTKTKASGKTKTTLQKLEKVHKSSTTISRRSKTRLKKSCLKKTSIRGSRKKKRRRWTRNKLLRSKKLRTENQTVLSITTILAFTTSRKSIARMSICSAALNDRNRWRTTPDSRTRSNSKLLWPRAFVSLRKVIARIRTSDTSLNGTRRR